MARKFNLQPWRSELRAQQKKEFNTITAVVGLSAIALCGAYYFFKNQYLESQTQAISTLDSNIAQLKKAEDEINKMKALNEEVIKQILVIQALQNQRSLSVEILDHIAANIPESVFLNKISYNQGQLMLSGTAETEIGVSSFIRVLNNFPHFASVRLIDMQKAQPSPRYFVTEDTGVRTFSLLITVEPKFDNNIDVSQQ